MLDLKLSPLKAVLLFLTSALTIAAVLSAQQGGRSENPARYETADRNQWQMPDKVVEALDLKPGMVVADIGAASGYFSRRFSPAVGPRGRVLAVDIDGEALAWLARQAGEQGLANLDTLHALPDDPRLPEKGVDLVFMCNTLHHIPNRPAYLRRLRQSLTANGRVAIVDFFKKDLPVGPSSPEHKLSREEAIAAFTAAGYTIDREFDFLAYQYFFIARPE